MSAKIGGHFTTILSDNQYTPAAFGMGKITSFKDYIVTRCCNIVITFQFVIPCKEKNARAAKTCSFCYSFKNCWPGRKISNPVQYRDFQLVLQKGLNITRNSLEDALL